MAAVILSELATRAIVECDWCTFAVISKNLVLGGSQWTSVHHSKEKKVSKEDLHIDTEIIKDIIRKFKLKHSKEPDFKEYEKIPLLKLILQYTITGKEKPSYQ